MATTTRQATVLLVEHAPEFRQLLQAVLGDEGYGVRVAVDGDAAVRAARELDPDVIVIDLGLPGIEGVEICRELRTFTDAYVIMLTTRCQDVDRRIGITTAADDYMTKPFCPEELVARIAALTWRPRPTPDQTTTSGSSVIRGDIRINGHDREVRVGGSEVELNRVELELLWALCECPTMVYSRQMLLERVWGHDQQSDHQVVDVHIANLRRKIDTNGTRHIKTVRGAGYRLA